MNHQNLQEWALRARRDAVPEDLEVVERILPPHDDLSCCFDLRQNILSGLADRLSHPAASARQMGDGIQVIAGS